MSKDGLSNLAIEIDRQRRERFFRCALSFAVATALIVASTLAVRYELSVGSGDGVFAAVIGLFEVIFIAAILPLTVTALYSLATLASIAWQQHRTKSNSALPQARAGG